MSVTRTKPQHIEPIRTGFNFKDFIIVVLSLAFIVFFINLFRLDLFHTINLQNVKPVGDIVIKQNVVQRRIADRVLWDRLEVKSPVYLGDLIRIPEHSSATLNIEEQQIDLHENTLIRIQRSQDGSTFQIELTEGSLAVTTSDNGAGIQLNLMGRMIETAAGSFINVSTGENGMVLQVNEGKAVLIQEGANAREVTTGSMISMDTRGFERHESGVVVMRPRSNARYLQMQRSPVTINFSWNRINLESNDLLRLEIAADGNFTRTASVLDNLNDSAVVSLNSGAWFWRLLKQNEILSSGRINIVEINNINLINPVRDSIIRYNNELPTINFSWSAIDDASFYIFQISRSANFSLIEQNIQMTANSFVQTNLGQGIWYWRVIPVFSSAYEGQSNYSASSNFSIEQTAFINASQENIITPQIQSPVMETIEPAETVSALTDTPSTEPVAPPPVAAQPRPAVRPTPRPAPRPVQRPVPQPAPAAQPVIVPGQQQETVLPETLPETQPLPAAIAEATSAIPTVRIPLTSPANLLPEQNYQISIEYLRNSRSLVFSWSPVQGANAYIFSLYLQGANGTRHLITQTAPENRASWTLVNLNTIARGNYFWQVEALEISEGGIIERRSAPSENSFVVDIPLPEVHANRTGVLYGQ